MMRRLQTAAGALLLTLSPALYAQAPSQSPTDVAAPADAPPAPPASAPDAPSTDALAPAPSPAPAPSSAPVAAPSNSPGPTGEPARSGWRAPLAKRARPLAPGPVHAASPSAPASEPDLDDGPAVEAAALPTLSAWLGVGGVWLPSDGLDPFAKDDGLLMFSAGAALSLTRAEALDVAAVAGWDATSSDEHYRGEPTSLGLMRFALGPELRGSIIDRLFWHGRLSPTLARLSVELEESSSGSTLQASRWVWGAEAAVGLDVRLADVRVSSGDAIGIFARVEGGYAWSPASQLSLEPDGSNAPVRSAPLELGELALAGPSFKASIGAGF
jgi:hypothetical protein